MRRVGNSYAVACVCTRLRDRAGLTPTRLLRRGSELMLLHKEIRERPVCTGGD